MYAWQNGTKSAGFETEKLKISHFPLASIHVYDKYCHSLISYFVFFQTIKYFRDWADMIFKDCSLNISVKLSAKYTCMQ